MIVASAEAVAEPRASVGRGRIARTLSRIRWQLAIGLLLTVWAPAVIRWPDRALSLTTSSLNNAMVGAGLAMMFGYVAARRLASFPGIQILALTLPAFSISYGSVAVFLLFARVDYSRYELLASFFLSVAFFSYSMTVERRVKRSKLAVVPHGKVAAILDSSRVDCAVWHTPGQMPSGFHGVVADLRAQMGGEWEAFLARCALGGIPVYHVKQVQEALTGRVDVEYLSENNLGSLNPSPLYGRAKRGVDLLVVLLALPFAFLVLALVALAIKWDSPGSVFFRQPRVGHRGQIFNIWKLRTMRIGADGGHYTASAADPRITRTGRLLRKYRIDELPQMLNIVRGEMSWIGPRPESIALSAWYEREIGFYSYRHIVRPGITGWAQVHQGSAAGPEEVKHKLHYDFYYIKHFSAWLDLVIAAQTVRTVLTGFGAR